MKIVYNIIKVVNKILRRQFPSATLVYPWQQVMCSSGQNLTSSSSITCV